MSYRCNHCGQEYDAEWQLKKQEAACASDKEKAVEVYKKQNDELWELLKKPRLPWRKVSEKPEDGQDVVVWRRYPSGRFGIETVLFWNPAIDFFRNGDTRWCYADELKPEDTE